MRQCEYWRFILKMALCVNRLRWRRFQMYQNWCMSCKTSIKSKKNGKRQYLPRSSPSKVVSFLLKKNALRDYDHDHDHDHVTTPHCLSSCNNISPPERKSSTISFWEYLGVFSVSFCPFWEMDWTGLWFSASWVSFLVELALALEILETFCGSF